MNVAQQAKERVLPKSVKQVNALREKEGKTTELQKELKDMKQLMTPIVAKKAQQVHALEKERKKREVSIREV